MISNATREGKKYERRMYRINRELAMGRLEREIDEQSKEERKIIMREKNNEAQNLIRERIEKILNQTEGEKRAKDILIRLNYEVYSKYKTPIHMLNKAFEYMKSVGVNTERFVWVLNYEDLKDKVHAITN